MQWLAPHLQDVQAIVAAVIDETGCLVEANRGFLRLIGVEALQASGALVARFFIQPDFATLVEMPAAAEGEIYRGLLTFGEYMGQTRSLRARIWRHGHVLRVLAESDIAELEALCVTALELNRDYANSQLALARSNLKLKQSEAQLKQLVSDLSTANAQRKQAQDQLLQSERLASIGFLAAGVAHEINNPLGYVSSNLSTVTDYIDALLQIIDAYQQAVDPADAAAEQLARVIKLQQALDLDFIKEDIGPLLRDSRTGLARVKQVVQALKDFSGVDTLRASEEVDVGQTLETTLCLLLNELRHCEVRNELVILPLVECVSAELGQVFMNLLLNAAQAIETHGVVTIRGGHDSDEVWIEIADSGKGIAPEHLPHIFDPFFTTKPLGQGTGLGLSVAHGLIGMQRGRIEVASELGKGSRFTIHLPIRHA